MPSAGSNNLVKSGGVKSAIQELEDFIKNGSKVIEISYSDLKTLRNNSNLIPGQWYRITDYVTTTTQKDTQSAGHQFDVIVRADSTNVLNENAYAAKHEGDTYFANSKINSWELKYCIDNIAWAAYTPGMSVSGVTATADGKETYSGIEYYKLNLAYSIETGIYPGHKTSVVYTRTLDNGATVYAWLGSMVSFSSLSAQSGEDNGRGVVYYMKDEYNNECYYDFKNIQFLTDGIYLYTFNLKRSSVSEDLSIRGTKCFGNKIGPYIVNKEYKLPFNVFKNTGSYADSECCMNTLSKNCYNNTFGDGCRSNTFGNSCHSNTFGNDCYNNTFGNGYQYNTFGNKCQSNTFGNDCYKNTFGNDCYKNTFGNYCYYNTFGSNCYYNTFGNDCDSNTFVDYCDSNTFGNRCTNIKFGTSSTTKNYCQYIIIENGNKCIYLDCSATTSSSSYFQNVKIAQGVNNTSSYKTITHTTAGDTFQTIYKPINSEEISV